MIGRQHRFHGHTSLSFVYRRGTMVRTQHMGLKSVRNPQRQTYRMAVIVSRKVHKSAVKRNRVRRRLYAIIQSMPIAEPYDLVLTVFSEQVVDMPAPELECIVRGLLTRAHIISAHRPAATAGVHGIVGAKEKR